MLRRQVRTGKASTHSSCQFNNLRFVTTSQLTILRTDFERKGLPKQARNCLNVSVQLPLKRFLTYDNCH
jgi:hypothetical protein